MKKINNYVILGLFVALPFSASSAPISYSNAVVPSTSNIVTDLALSFSPSPQTTNDFITAQVSGTFPSLGFILDNTSLKIIDNTFKINFSISSPTGIVGQQIDPFDYSVNLGQLDVGTYYVSANFFVDGSLDNSISDNFSVTSAAYSTWPWGPKKLKSNLVSAKHTPVPLPATVWLFLSGIVSLFTLNRRHKKNSSILPA